MQVIPSAWLRLFNPKEVNELLSGGEGGGVDAEDMQRHATYSGGYSTDSRTIKLFWKVGSPANLHLTQAAAHPNSQRGRTGHGRETDGTCQGNCAAKSKKTGHPCYPPLLMLPCEGSHACCRWLPT